MTFKKLVKFAKFAKDLSDLSKCSDGHVAAIIISPDGNQVLSIGVNGGAGKFDCLCKLGDKYSCIHAEANALAKCRADCTGAAIICTKAPCIQCAALIINAGIKHVYFLEAYKRPQGLQLLQRSNILVYRIDIATNTLYSVIPAETGCEEVKIGGPDNNYFND